MIPSRFFHHIYHIGCAFNLHSIINKGLILGGQNSSKRKTVFFLPFDPRDKEHKDPEKIDLNVPRRAQYLHNAWKKHQDVVYWVDVNLAIRKGLTFYQTRSNAIILQETLPAYCVPKVVRLITGEVLYEKACMSPRFPPKISLRHEWTKELGSKVDRQPEGEVARQPEGEVARQAKFFQPTQPIPNPIPDRSGQLGKHIVAVQDDPEVYHEAKTLITDNETIREKRSHGVNVQNLIQKIENHPQRRALQSDLQQHRQFNPFRKESRDVIKAAGNTEQCELLDVEPKAQCKVCLSHWDIGIVYCTFGHFLRKGRVENQKFIKYTMDLLSIPDYHIKKGRHDGHRYGKKPGDKEYYIVHQLKKKYFQGIHDRFVRDEKFRKNMIDNGRTEEVCPQIDDLADEEHTHHLTPQEYYHYKSNWRLTSNKKGSNTVPVQRRSDSRQALSTLQQLKEEEEEAQRNQRWAQRSSSPWWSWQGSWWTPYSFESHHGDEPSTD